MKTKLNLPQAERNPALFLKHFAKLILISVDFTVKNYQSKSFFWADPVYNYYDRFNYQLSVTDNH